MKEIKVKVTPDDTELQKKLKDLESGKHTVKVDIDGSNAKNTTQVMSQLAGSAAKNNTIFGKLKNTISNTFSTGKLAMTGYLAVLNEIRIAAKDAKDTIEDMDAAITNLSVAMNTNRNEASSYLKMLNEQAISLKTTTKSASDAADTWLRQGKTVQETQTLIKDSLVFSKVAQLESADATNYLTSALNGYKLEAKDAESVIDKLTAVDAVSASEAGGLSLAMSKTASAADMAGISMDRLVGYIAAVKESTRAADQEVGNALKSMISRMNQVKAGKFIDAETGESLNDFEKVMNKVGIAIRDASGQFISSENILDELGAKFSSFDSVTQRAVATALGGTHQYEKVIALLSNYNKALKYAEVAENSAGSAMNKFENSYMDSLEAKQNELQATFESLVMNSDLSEVYGNIIEATTAMTKFVDETNLLKGALSGAVVGGSIKLFASLKAGINEAYITLNKFKVAMDVVGKASISTKEFDNLKILCNGLSKSQMKLILSTKTLTVEQKKQLLMANGLSEQEAILQLQTWKMSTANTGLAASTTTASNAFKGLWLTLKANPLILFISAVTTACMVINKLEKQAEEARQAAQDTANTYKESTASIEDYVSQYKDLQQALQDAKGNEEETANVKSQLLNLQTELNEKFGDEYEKINLVTDAYKDQTEVILGYNKAKAAELLNDNDFRGQFDKAEEAMTKNFKSSLSGIYTEKEYNKDITDPLKAIAKQFQNRGIYLDQNEDGSSFSVKINVDKAEEAYDTINDFETALRKKASELGNEHLFDDILDISGNALDNAEKTIDKWGDIYEQGLMAKIADSDELSQGMNEATDAVKAYNEAVANSSDPYNDEEVAKAKQHLDEVKASMQNADGTWNDTWQKFGTVIDNVFDDADTRLYDFNQALSNDKTLKNLAEKLKGYSADEIRSMANDGDNGDAYDKLNNAAKEYNLTVDELIDSLVRLGYVQGEVETSTDELYLSFDGSELGERMDYLNQKFSDGEITVREYFDALRNEIENTDFSEFTNEAAASQQFFTDSLQDLAGGLSNVINDFDSGQSSITEYLEGYLSIADTLSTLTDDLQENSSAWNENGESISDATSEMLDGAQSGLSSAIENVRQYQDSIYSLEQIMNGAVEEGTDEFTAHSQVIAEDLAHIVSTGGQMADEVKQYIGTTTNEIAQSLTDNVDNQSLAAQAIAANTNTAIADMATNVGKIFDTLGNAIKNFNVDITFSVKEFSLKKIAMGLLGKQELPEIKFGISASGKSLNAIGDAVSSLGKSISTNLAPQQIELPDFKKVDDKYTPNAKVLDNYNNKLDDLKNKSKKATDALKDQKEALEKTKDAYEDTKEELEDLADAIAWFYDNQIDKIDKQINKLNDANDALNDQKDTYDDILDAIDKVYEAQINAIQERIDALDEANDEEEKALELEKAKQALEDARHKKNIKVYAQGKGMVFTVDSSEIADAQKEYDNLVDEMQKDEIKKALEDQIEALNKLRDTFADIPNAWKDAMNKLKASEMFGSNWEIDILNPSDDLINNFRNQYTGTQDQIQSNENKIDSLEAEKERIEELKKLWEDAKNAYKYSQYEAKLSSFFGSDYEYQLLNNSAAWRGKFIEEYSSVCAQIEALEQQIKNLENESAESASSAADSTSEALGKTSNAIRDASNTAKDNSIGKYLWGQEDDAALTAAKLRLMDLNDQLSKGANDDLVNAKNAVQNFITEWANLKNTGEITDGLTQSINNLQIADGDYFEKYGNVIGNVKDRLSESAQYTNNAAQCVKDASGNIELLNQQLATLNTSTDNVEATADQAVSDAGVTVDGSLEKITALKDAMGELVTAKAELQSAVDESVTDVSDVITVSGDKVTTIQDQVTVLIDNIDRLNDAMTNLADKMSTLDDVTLDSVCNALGAADGSTGLIGSINSVITAINGENGLIVQLGAVNTASLEEITLGFGSEDGVGLLGAVQNVNNAIYVEDSEECLIGKINKIAETITTIDSASNAFLIMRANILLAEAEVQKLIDLINSIPEEKHTYHYIHTVNVGEATGTALTGYASGTATPSGSSYVRGTGNWGLQQDEKKAAVGELGSEILLRDGHWFMINKPQLMDLKKGDIIFNHAQTESIIRNGKNDKIEEFARMAEPVAEKLHKQGNSFADGTLPKGWRKVDVFEDLRNSGAVYDMDKFDAACAKLKANPAAIETMMYNPNNMPDWNKLAGNGQVVNMTNNNQRTNTTLQFNGDLSFPNIKSGDDAKKLMNELQHLSLGFLQRANRH